MDESGEPLDGQKSGTELEVKGSAGQQKIMGGVEGSQDPCRGQPGKSYDQSGIRTHALSD